MKNGELPAHPVECQYGSDKLEGLRTGEYSGFETGLTKREYFAGLAMQGIITGIYGGGRENYINQLKEWVDLASPLDKVGEALAKDAIGYADCLLKQLETK
jgi:hypothetical protein